MSVTPVKGKVFSRLVSPAKSPNNFNYINFHNYDTVSDNAISVTSKTSEVLLDEAHKFIT